MGKLDSSATSIANAHVNACSLVGAIAICMLSIACVEIVEETSSTTQGVYTIPGGVECYVDTPAYDQFVAGGCGGFWHQGPLLSTATFRLSTTVLALLGDGSSPNFAWSDPRCPANPYQYCTLPIRRFVPLTLHALLTSPTNGTLVYESSATAEYVTVLY
jgi:hypothetical protein